MYTLLHSVHMYYMNKRLTGLLNSDKNKKLRDEPDDLGMNAKPLDYSLFIQTIRFKHAVSGG